MTIDERIAWAKKQRNVAYKKDSVQGIVYWDGYLDALKEVRNEEKASELDELRKKLAEAEDKIMALCVEQGDYDEMTTYILNHYAKVKVCEVFEEIAKIIQKYDKIAERDKSEYGELIVMDIGCAIGELKKKYTEGEG